MRGRVPGGKARPQARHRGTPASVLCPVSAQEPEGCRPSARRYVYTDGKGVFLSLPDGVRMGGASGLLRKKTRPGKAEGTRGVRV